MTGPLMQKTSYTYELHFKDPFVSRVQSTANARREFHLLRHFFSHPLSFQNLLPPFFNDLIHFDT
jgi:hypothetical protein